MKDEENINVYIHSLSITAAAEGFRAGRRCVPRGTSTILSSSTRSADIAATCETTFSADHRVFFGVRVREKRLEKKIDEIVLSCNEI